MAMSHTTRSGARALARATASTPLLAEMASKPSSTSNSLTLLSSSGSSSTTRILGIAYRAPDAGPLAERGRAGGDVYGLAIGAGLERRAWRVVRRERQPDVDGGAAPALALHLDASALHVDGALDDGEPEASARRRAHVLASIEAVEQVRQVVLGDAHAAVAHRAAHAVALDRQLQADLAARVRILQRVLEQVTEHVRQQAAIEVRPGLARDAELDGALAARRARERLDQALRELLQIDLDGVGGQHSHLG